MADNVARALALAALKNTIDLKKQLNGTSFEYLTKEQYDSLESKDSKTIYIVTENDSTNLYIGDTLLTNGAGNANLSALVVSFSDNPIIGDFTEESEVR